MTLALAEPARVPKPDLFYSPGRIAHWFGHLRCDGVYRRLPGTCMNDPYDADRVRGTGPEPAEYSGADMYVDIYGVWDDPKFPYDYKRVLISLYFLGPRFRMESDDEWRNRQLGWWSKHRHRFRQIEPEYAVRLVQDAVEHIAYKLGWRPEAGEK
jgi:hypothetical protein